MPRARKGREGKRKRQKANAGLTPDLAALIYASQSEDSEKEEWGGTEWEVGKITGEAIDMCGRREYRVQWSSWNRRKTGENFTWGNTELHLSGAVETMEEWKADAKAKRAAIREKHKREGVPVSLFAHGCFTNFNTILHEIGMGTESDNEDYDAPANWSRAADLEAQLDALEPPQALEVHHPRQPEAGPSRSTGTSSEKRHYRRSAIPAIPGEDRLMDLDLPPLHSPSGNDMRNSIQASWDVVTRERGAARVTIVNDIDDEPIPPSIDANKFRYCEVEYPDAESQIDALVGCDCQGACTNPLNCHCQEAADTAYIGREGGVAKFAYENGLFTFKLKKPHQVVECNLWCTCDDTCGNRVAQRPRRVPMEVYKTMDRGWAVRTTVDVRRGEVMGIFTGELFEKKENEDQYRSDGSYRDPGYTYNLDWFQPENWAIDSQFFGNWSRFLNHSCFPNLQVYSVSWDSVPDINRGRLAFVAKEPIRAGTELTIDYWPSVPTRPEDNCICIYKPCMKR